MQKKQKTYVIGDLYGNLNGLKEILNQIEYVPGDDKLIFLGNYVGLWDDCYNLVEFLMKLKTFGNCVFLKGSNDFKFKQGYFTDNYDIYEKFIKDDWFVDHLSHYSEIDDLDKLIQHEEFFDNLSYYHNEKILINKQINTNTYQVYSKNFVFVSAGWNIKMYLNIKTGIEAQGGLTMLYDTKLWNLANHIEDSSVPYPRKVSFLYDHIYVGSHYLHDYKTASNPTGLPRPIIKSNVTCLNTSEQLDGVVSAIHIEEQKTFVSRRGDRLYPAEYRDRIDILVNGYHTK